MKKNGSESSTASMSTGSAYGDEDPIASTAGAGGTRRGSGNVSGSLSGTVSSLSGSIVTYQVSDSTQENVVWQGELSAFLDEVKAFNFFSVFVLIRFLPLFRNTEIGERLRSPAQI